jgi:hypothetical protein
VAPETDPLLVLCRCLSNDRTDRAVGGLRRDIAALADLRVLYNLAEREHVAPLLYKSLERDGLLDLLPDEERRLLRARYHFNVLRNEQFRRLAVDLTGALNDAGITPILLKGGVTLFDARHGDPKTRVMADLDMLVPKERYAATMDVVHKMGLTATIEDYDWTFASSPMQRPHDVGPVELHYYIGEQRDVLPPAPAWHDAVPLDAGGPNLRALSPTHRIVHNILHSEVQDRGHALRLVRVRQLHEMAHLARNYDGDIDWPVVGELFARHRLTAIARARFSLAARLLGAAMPPGFTLDNGRHLRRCLRADRSPPLRAALGFIGGISAPLTTRHLDMIYGCGTEPGLRLQLYRIRHVFHLALRHRSRIGEKVRYAAGMYR